MGFLPKYLAVITINNVAYEYYADINLLAGLIEQTPTLQIVDQNGIWQIADYFIAHTIKLDNLYQVPLHIPSNNFNTPMYFLLEPYVLTIDNFFTRGGEAVIYQGTLNHRPVIIKTYIKNPKILPQISQKLALYTTIKYLLFTDITGAYFVVMEELQELVYNNRTLQQGLAFINLLESIGARHGDISRGNIMQDTEGNIKFIDFARSKNTGTFFYNKGNNDRSSLARTLLSYKYQLALSTTPLLDGVLKKDEKRTLSKLYRVFLRKYVSNDDNVLNKLSSVQVKILDKQFFDWFQQNFIQDDESRKLIDMAT